MNISAKPRKIRVLVTGAGGFVGGWFVEAIHLGGWADVRAGVSRWSSAARIARFPVELRLCDVMDEGSLELALKDVDVVVHCARGREDDSPVTTLGTQRLLSKARESGVRKVIFMSSVAVYGDAIGVVSETTPTAPTTVYGAAKLQGEDVCRKMADEAMSVAVMRPTLIYGPYSEQWTTPFIRRFASGRWRSLGERGEGKCNIVYVGDLVRFARHLMYCDTGAFSVFNANGPDTPTWNAYIERFNDLLGFPALQAPSPLQGLSLGVAMRRPVRRLGKYMLNHHRGLLVGMAARSAALRDAMRRTEEDLRLSPNDDELVRFGTDVIYANDSAARIGFTPPTGFERGLALTASWARDLGLAA